MANSINDFITCARCVNNVIIIGAQFRKRVAKWGEENPGAMQWIGSWATNGLSGVRVSQLLWKLIYFLSVIWGQSPNGNYFFGGRRENWANEGNLKLVLIANWPAARRAPNAFWPPATYPLKLQSKPTAFLHCQMLLRCLLPCNGYWWSALRKYFKIICKILGLSKKSLGSKVCLVSK